MECLVRLCRVSRPRAVSVPRAARGVSRVALSGALLCLGVGVGVWMC